MAKKFVKRTDANNETLYFYTHSDVVDVGEGNNVTSLTNALNSKASASDVQALSDDVLRKSSQTLSNQEKEQVHNNLSTESFIDDRAVRYDEPQVLGSDEKAQALTNLGLNGVDEEPTPNSDNLVKSGGVAETNGYNTHDSEWVKVCTDRLGRILYGIKKDGEVVFGVGVPKVIKDYITELVSGKVDKISGKGLSTNDYTDNEKDVVSFHEAIIDSQYLRVETDSEGRILSGTKKDGSHYIHNIESEPIDEITEKLQVLTEAVDSNTEIINNLRSGSNVIKVTKNGTDINIRSSLSADKDIIIRMYKNSTGQGMTFRSFYVGEKELSDAELLNSEYLIRSIPDMVGAIGVIGFWFLYAQHGWTIPKFKATTQTLTSEDIGSKWSDGSHLFTVGKIDGRYIYLIPEVTFNDSTGTYTSSWEAQKHAYPTNITHVSGAIHTSPISGTSSRYDLVIQKVTSRKFLANGHEITEDGVYYCSEFAIKENILGYNIGTVSEWFPSPVYNGSMIDWDRTFTFSGSTVEVNTIINCQFPFIIDDYRGCIPQMPLQVGDYHSYSMIPKVKKVVNSHRVDIPFMTDDGTERITASRTTSDLYDVDNQPERCINYLKDSNDNYLVGMASGCSLVRGISKNEVRNIRVPVGQNSCTYGGSDVLNKFYPKVLQRAGFENGIVDDSFIGELSCYYCWFDPSANNGQVYWYKDNGDYIVYIHNQESHDKLCVRLPDFMEGMTVDTIIEKTNGATLLTDSVVSNNIYVKFDTTDNIANYIVLRLK